MRSSQEVQYKKIYVKIGGSLLLKIELRSNGSWELGNFHNKSDRRLIKNYTLLYF